MGRSVCVLGCCSLLLMYTVVGPVIGTQDEGRPLVWDDRGYLFFCLCMGRFGNQVDHFLGGLAFAKQIDRTLVVPPFRTYTNVAFSDWFRLDALARYHRVVGAEEFMEGLAPQHWPRGNRTGLCFSYKPGENCNMKNGSQPREYPVLALRGAPTPYPVLEENRRLQQYLQWSDLIVEEGRFPALEYPVLALRGAPAPYPVLEENRSLQQYLQWSDLIVEEGQRYIHNNFPGQKFLGIHLRNGKDWENACSHIEDGRHKSYMASPQCIQPSSGRTLTKDICLPDTDTVLRQTEKIIKENYIQVIYVATDRHPLVKELAQHLHQFKVQVYHGDPYLPQVDLYILGRADHFIGNCVSSFTAFVTRERTLANKPTQFWGL